MKYIKRNIFVIYGAVLATVIISSLLFQVFFSSYIDLRAQKLVDVLQSMELVQSFSVQSIEIEEGVFVQKGAYVVIKVDKSSEEFLDEVKQYFLYKNYIIDEITQGGSIRVHNELYRINVGPIYNNSTGYTGKWMISIYYNNILTTLNL